MDEMIGRLIFGLDDVEQDSESLEIEFEPYKCMFCQMIQNRRRSSNPLSGITGETGIKHAEQYFHLTKQ